MNNVSSFVCLEDVLRELKAQKAMSRVKRAFDWPHYWCVLSRLAHIWVWDEKPNDERVDETIDLLVNVQEEMSKVIKANIYGEDERKQIEVHIRNIGWRIANIRRYKRGESPAFDPDNRLEEPGNEGNVNDSLSSAFEPWTELDAFLCYASVDKEAIVKPFAKAMEDVGLRPWIDEGQIKRGDNLICKVSQGLLRSTHVVVFLSDAFIEKEWPEKELWAALSMKREGRALVLPVLCGITSEALGKRNPMLANKSFQVIPGYSPSQSANSEVLKGLVLELKRLVQPSPNYPE